MSLEDNPLIYLPNFLYTTQQEPFSELQLYHKRLSERRSVPWIGINNYGVESDTLTYQGEELYPTWMTDTAGGVVDCFGYNIPMESEMLEHEPKMDPVTRALAILEGEMLPYNYAEPVVEIEAPNPVTEENAEYVSEDGAIVDWRDENFLPFQLAVRAKAWLRPYPPLSEEDQQRVPLKRVGSKDSQGSWGSSRFRMPFINNVFRKPFSQVSFRSSAGSAKSFVKRVSSPFRKLSGGFRKPKEA